MDILKAFKYLAIFTVIMVVIFSTFNNKVVPKNILSQLVNLAEGAETASTTTLFFTRTLRVGDTGDDVTLLQKFLISEKFFVFPANTAYGRFGELTRGALIKWQLAHGLPGVGILGPLTRAQINNMGIGTTLIAEASPNKYTVSTSNTLIGTLNVMVKVINTGGGAATPPSFHVTVMGASANPSSFSGSSSGTNVTVVAGMTYSVSVSTLKNYSSPTSNCTGSVAGGSSSTCTITETYLGGQ